MCSFIFRVVTLMLPDLAAFHPSVVNRANNTCTLGTRGALKMKASTKSHMLHGIYAQLAKNITNMDSESGIRFGRMKKK